MTLKIATWNVNSIKSRLHVLLPWLRQASPDILLLQETKVTDDAFPRLEVEDLGYNLALFGQKSYNGVAIFSKPRLEDIQVGLPGDGQDLEARYVEAVATLPSGTVRVASVYVPNGQSESSDKFAYKLRFLERLREHLRAMLRHEEPFIAGGDYNVAPYTLDVYDPKRLDGSICYHPLERWALRGILHLGYYDAFRLLHPARKSFSWWDYRGGDFANDHGMRIDHLLLSPQAADRLQSCRIEHETRALEKPSDHAPVLGEFNA